MSVSTEITRIQTDRNTIRNKLIELGLADSTSNLDALATAIAGIADKGSPTASVRVGEAYTIAAGYYQGGTVAGVQGEEDFQLQAKAATPTKQQQQIAPDTGYYGLSAVIIGAIPAAYQDVTSVDATAGDVLANKKIVTANGTLTAGTMPNNGKVTAVVSVASPSYTIPAGYHNGQGTVSVTAEEKSATPSTSAQEITPTSGKVLSKVTVAAIPAIYGDATNADAAAANILSGKKAVVKVDGAASLVTGSMTNNGAISGTIDGLSAASYTIPAGYTSGGSVSLTSDIENALAAI